MKNSEIYTPFEFGDKACETLIAKFKASELPPVGRFHYHQGVFLLGMQRLMNETNNETYFQYVKNWVDSIILEDGTVTHFNADQLDDIQPAILLFDLYSKTNDERYKKAIYTLVPLIPTLNKTSQGGIWHKLNCPNQMWLDGLFMGGPVSTLFAKTFDESKYFDMVINQFFLLYNNTYDAATGLLFHGWDESKQALWADPTTGRAPEIWGRALGWVPAATLDILDNLPEDHPARPKMIEILKNLLISIAKYQDDNTGLWYQVINKGYMKDNWLENSCSSLFVYSIAKAVRKGFLDSSYLKYAKKGYDGVVNSIKFDQNNHIIINNICIGTGIGDYSYYINRPTTENDLHGAGAFIIMCTEMGLIK
jgi:unsaturated rhamnogalacturonyl hydrolase